MARDGNAWESGKAAGQTNFGWTWSLWLTQGLSGFNPLGYVLESNLKAVPSMLGTRTAS